MDGGREDGSVADVDEDRAPDSVPKSTPMAYLLNVPPECSSRTISYQSGVADTVASSGAGPEATVSTAIPALALGATISLMAGRSSARGRQTDEDEGRRALVLYDRRAMVDLIELTLNHGLFKVRAAASLSELEPSSDWHPHLALVDMEHDDSAALLTGSARRGSWRRRSPRSLASPGAGTWRPSSGRSTSASTTS